MNPLDTTEIFHFSGFNPNPSFSKTKDGPVYRISFEVEQDVWQQFVDANTKGMIIDFAGTVQEKQPEPEKPKGGAKSREAAFLCEGDDFNLWADKQLSSRYNVYAQLESAGKELIYHACKITSRAELDHNPEAYETFKKIEKAFYQSRSKA